MSLIAWWTLTEGSLKNLIDASNPLIATNTSVNTYTSDGKIGSTYTNTSNSSGSLVSQKSFLLPQTQSMFCWLYMTDVYDNASLNAVCGQHRHETNSGMGITIKYNTSTSGYLSVNTGNGSSRTYNAYCGSTLLSAGKWYHVGYTYDGSKIRLYVNGKLDGTHDYTGQKQYEEPFGAFMWSFSSKTIGDRAPYANYIMKGKLNDIRVYDHTLSDLEVKEISKALVVHYTFNDVLAESTTNYSNPSQWSIFPSYWTLLANTDSGFKIKKTSGNTETTVAFSNGSIYGQMAVGDIWTTTCYLYKNNRPYKSSINALTNYGLGISVLNFESRDDGYYSSTFKINSKSNAYLMHARIFGDTVSEDDTYEIKFLQFEKKDHATPYTPSSREGMLVNEAGYNSSGAIYNSSLVKDTAIGSLSCHTPRIKPDDINTMVNTTNAAYVYADVFGYNHTPTEFTVAWWWKVVDWGYVTGPFGLVISNGNYMDSTLGVHDGAVYVNFTGGNTRVSRGFTGGGTGKWTHFALTFKPGSYTSYINGVSQGTVTTDATLTLDPWRYLYLGAGCAGGCLRDGDIYWGDFRYYNTCLSADDIKDLYQTKAYISDKGDIMCNEFVESKSKAQVTCKGTFEANEFYEEIDEAYEVLEYIENTSANNLQGPTPSIDTGIIPKLPFKAVAEITTVNTTASDEDGVLLGVHSGSAFIPFYIYQGKWHSDDLGIRIGDAPNNTYFKIEYDATTSQRITTINGVQNIYNGSKTLPNESLWVMNGHWVGSQLNRGANVKLHNLMIINEGKLERYYIPVRQKSTGNVGLYDCVYKVFYKENSGSSIPFTAGSTLTNSDASIYETQNVSGRNLIEI